MSRLETQNIKPWPPLDYFKQLSISFNRYSGLKWRAALLLLLSPLAILSGFFVWQDYKSEHRSTIVEVRGKSALVNAQLEDFLHSVNAVSDLYADHWVEMFPGQTSDQSTMQVQQSNLQEFVKHRPHFSMASITDSSGFSIVSSDDLPDGTRLGPTELYQRANSKGEFASSDVINAPADDTGVILFVQPIYRENSGANQFLVLQSELSVISEALDLGTGFPQSAKAGIFDRDGTVLAGGGPTAPHPGQIVGVDISETELWSQAVTRPNQEWFGEGLDGENRIVFFRYPDSTNWITTVAYSQSDLFQPLLIRLIMYSGVLCVSFAATAYLGELLIRRERSVLANLEHGVEQRTAQLAATNSSLREEINQRTKAQESLVKSEKQQKALVAAIPDLILQIKQDETILNVKSAGDNNLLVIGKEQIGNKISQLLPTETAHLYSNSLLEAFETGTVQQFEHKLPGGDQNRSFEVRMVVSGIDEVVAIVRDVTEQKRLEEEFLLSQKLDSVGRLAGGIAHEFNNLLGAIIGFAALAEARIPSDSPAKGYISDVQEASLRAVDLTSKLLMFSRKKKAVSECILLNELVFDTERLLRPIIGEDIELVFLPGDELWPVCGDQRQIQQVLLNLATNARDAMPGGGKLTIKTANVVASSSRDNGKVSEGQGSYVILTVSDSGVGMTDDVKAHLFEPFFTTKDVGKGTGLGLAICYGIVTQSGGHIEVGSQPSMGTKFTIWLPRTDLPTSSSHSEVVKECSDLPRGNETILVVEDEPLVRKLAVQLLIARGYQVFEAGNGAEAISLVRNQPSTKIDLLLTDVVMPQMGGEELAENLHKMIPDIKVLFMSGYSKGFSSYYQSFGSYGGFIEKPFKPRELELSVRNILDSVEIEEQAPIVSNPRD